MHIKKRFFTLIETIVALFLITIILTFLFGYFSKITKTEKEIEDIKNIVYQKNHLHIRLNNIFSQINIKDFDQSPFYTKYENEKNLSLNLYFDNGVDPDPNFSDIIKAKIFIDKKKNLWLYIWARDKKIKDPKKELLLTNVDKIEYKFLASKDIQIQKYIIDKITDDYFWYGFWPKDKKRPPSVILIKINEKLDFAFFLPHRDVKI